MKYELVTVINNYIFVPVVSSEEDKRYCPLVLKLNPYTGPL